MAVNINEQDIVEVSAKARFEALDGDRSTVLDEARACAELTLPYLLPPDAHKENTILDNPYQNVGARLVNNLANKLAFTMLPPNTPFFRLTPDEDTRNLLEQQGEEALVQANRIAVAIENLAQKKIASEYLAVPVVELFKSLVVTGNALAVKIEPQNRLDKGLKTYRLDNYVINRDYRGNPIEIVTRETVNPNTLDEDIVTALDLDISDEAEDVVLYTRAVLKAGTWYEYQYIEDSYIDDSLATYSRETFPYIPLRWTSVNGHNYGVGHCSQHKSDLITLEGAYQLLLESASIAGKTVFGIKPGSQIDMYEFNNAQNGQAIFADFDNELTVARVEKHNDLQLVLNIVDQTTRRLEQAFLVASSAVRQSERTTATEIQYMAQDLEQSLGGVYSVFAQEFQVPLARLLLDSLPEVDTEGFEFIPVTGVEALGRNNDLQKLRQFSMLIQETPVLQKAIETRFNVDNYIEDITVASNLPSGRYIKTKEQQQAEAQAMQEQQLLAQGGGALAQAVGQEGGKALVNGGQQQGM